MEQRPQHPPAFIDRRLYSLGAPRRLFDEAARFFRGRFNLRGLHSGELLDRWMYAERNPTGDLWSLAVADEGPVGFALGRGLEVGAEVSLLYLSGRHNDAANARELLEVLGRGRVYLLAAESCLSPPPGDLFDVLTAAGWRRHPRLEYRYDLAAGPPRPDSTRVTIDGYRIRRMTPTDFDAAALLQATCYLGGEESRIQPRLADPRGSRALLDEVLAGRYGELLRRGCLVLEAADGALEGFLLSTRLDLQQRGEWAVVLSLGISPARRGRGLARELLRRALGVYFNLDMAGALLETGTVNQSARSLYRGLGFRLVNQSAVYRKRTEG
ncbi:MAG: GNAT family N-acetyltransferase [Candidatus Coatesbacteria bacterium]|nr:GNAT family N-acetyltransferase [Candidatus Coatesbacteria bacterium]